MRKGRIYVTGASGRLGRAVLEAVPEAIPLVRSAHGLPNEIVTSFSPDALPSILSDASVIIHLAASRDFLDMKKAREGNTYLTYQVLGAAPETSRIIFASSVSVYGKKLARIPADESTQVRPDTAYAKTKLEAEKIVEKHPDHVILRIGPIYGPGFDEYPKVLRLLADGKMRIIGNGENHIPFVHVDDVAAAIRSAITQGQGTYLLVGECLTQKEIYGIASRELGVEPPTKHIPAFIAMMLAHLDSFRSRIFGKMPKFIPEDIAVLSSDRVFDCSKAKRELGFSPKPIEQGIKEMVSLLKKGL